MINTALFMLLACFWGGSFVAIKFLIHDIPSFTAAFYRVFFSTIFLSLIFMRSIKIPKGFWGKELIYSVIAGLCSIGIPFSLLFWGERFVSPSIAGVLNGTVPFFTLIIGIVFLRQIKSITFEKVIGLFAGFIGIALIFGPRVSFKGDSSEMFGLLAIIGMSFFYGIGINLNRKILTKNKIITGNLSLIIQHIVSFIYLAILMLFVDGIPDLSLLLKSQNALSLFYISFISTCLAFIIFYRLIREMGSVEASSVTFFVPAIALILDNIIYDQSLSMNEGIGTGIIFLSMFFLREKKS